MTPVSSALISRLLGDGDAVRVAREVGQNLLWSGERRLGVDVPVGVIERFEERLERRLVGERGVRAEELQSALRMCCFQQRQHLATEHPRPERAADSSARY